MVFWGIEITPARQYAHEYDGYKGRLHISQATLGSSSSSVKKRLEKSYVQCQVGNESPVLLCSLVPGKIESCPLNLEFEEKSDVVFSVLGRRSIHLAGYYLVRGQHIYYESDNTNSDEGDITESESDESSDYESEEDEYEEDFFDDDDFEMFPPSPRPNSGVIIEEILDDEKPENGNGSRKRQKKHQPSDSDGNERYQQQIVIKRPSNPVLESEGEDGFPISVFKSKSKQTVKISETGGKQDRMTAKKGNNREKREDDIKPAKSKRKIGGQGREQISPPDSSGTVLENKGNLKKKKKEKRKDKADQATDDNKSPTSKVVSEVENMDQDLANKDRESDVKLSDDNETHKKKRKKGKKSKNEEQKVELQEPLKARTLSNGLIIEELAMGKPDGKRASRGNKVSVHYIGRLKKNGQIFDSNIGTRPFKFRLGTGKVIKGWDVGVNGMRVGDKRRFIIPPAMGYGAKGIGKIPGNAWLEFDVELVDFN